MTPKVVGIVGAEGVAALQLAGPIDALLAASLDDGYGGQLPCYSVCTIGIEDAFFRTDSGLKFAAEETLATARALDTIIIPAGRNWIKSRESEVLADWLLQRAGEVRRIAAIDTGVYPLAATGLLQGREVTVHWRQASDLARRYPTLRVNHRRPLVQDGPFYTSTGLTAGMGLALALIEEDYGRYVARAVADQMQLDLPAHEQVPPHDPRTHPINRFGELVSWIMRNLDSDLSVEILARRVGMAQDTFSRAFKSVFGARPSEFVENLRLNEARRRLSVRTRTLDTIAASVGYGSSDKLSRAFERRFGVRPSSVAPRPRNGSAAAA